MSMKPSSKPPSQKRGTPGTKAARILTGISIVLTTLAGNPEAINVSPDAIDNPGRAKLPPMPGSLPYLWQQFRRWLKITFSK
ncbi:MAG TPA: hypothetical protein VKB68_01250 [Stellaceae bacterium]|nr:hypothetical protein [Stellaceae bacterium]